MGDKKSNYRKTFKALEINISNCLAQLDHDPAREPKTLEDLDFDQFWKDIVAICQKLCFEANKIGLAWINPPVPSSAEMTQMSGHLEMACVALLGATASHPGEAGGMVNTQLYNVVVSIFEACVGFAKILQNTSGMKISSQNHPLLPQFGTIMKNCDAVGVLPRTNKDACVGVLNDEHLMLKDAVKELEEARDNVIYSDDIDEELVQEKWNESDKKIINPCLGLIKSAVALTKKTSDTITKFGKNDTKDEIAEYDKVVEVLGELSPTVDDLALTLYPPVSWEDVELAAEKLKNVVLKCFRLVDGLHFMGGEEANKWRAFLEKALTHNGTEIDRVIAEQKLENIQLGESGGASGQLEQGDTGVGESSL